MPDTLFDGWVVLSEETVERRAGNLPPMSRVVRKYLSSDVQIIGGQRLIILRNGLGWEAILENETIYPETCTITREVLDMAGRVYSNRCEIVLALINSEYESQLVKSKKGADKFFV